MKRVDGTALGAGNISSGALVVLVYNGTEFRSNIRAPVVVTPPSVSTLTVTSATRAAGYERYADDTTTTLGTLTINKSGYWMFVLKTGYVPIYNNDQRLAFTVLFPPAYVDGVSIRLR